MTSDSFNAAEYPTMMSEVVENLIVKSGKMLPKETKIPGDRIQKWKKYTSQYFRVSPNVYLIENEFFQQLSEN